MSSITYRKYGPLSLSAIVALTMIAEYYLTTGTSAAPTVTRVAADAWRQMGTTINLFATFLAIFVLSRTNISKISKAPKQTDKLGGIVMLGVMFFTMVLGLSQGYQGGLTQQWLRYTLTAASLASIGTANIWQFYAGYRTLRVRTPESTLLLLGALIVLIGYSAWGKMWIPGANDLASWSQLTILQPASRAIVIGGGIGAAYSSIRALAGKESTYLRSE